MPLILLTCCYLSQALLSCVGFFFCGSDLLLRIAGNICAIVLKSGHCVPSGLVFCPVVVITGSEMMEEQDQLLEVLPKLVWILRFIE